MSKRTNTKYHFLFGDKSTRMTYQKKDFLDYCLMSGISIGLIVLVFGIYHPITYVGLVLGVFMMVSFALRHGIEWCLPILLKRPQDVVYMVVYKLMNLRAMYFLALGILVVENIWIYLTPSWPHFSDEMRWLALSVFYLHFVGITIYRSIIFIEHLKKRDRVREILMQSVWKKALMQQPNIVLQIVHAYFTGIFTHVLLIAPWYFVLSQVQYSVLALPFLTFASLVIHKRYLNVLNDWFYRDHWLGHNSEFEFVYLHGPHHDAIPSGMIGVGGNGYLEGFFRHVWGSPAPFYHPLGAFLMYGYEVKADIDAHQYIPGIFPRLPQILLEENQHSIHHFGRLEPYGFGIRLDDPENDVITDTFKNTIKLDEELTDFKWDNSRYRWYLEICKKYHDEP